MPKGPNGKKRPADAVGLAVLIGRIATGEVEDFAPDDDNCEGFTNPESALRPELLRHRRPKKSS